MTAPFPLAVLSLLGVASLTAPPALASSAQAWVLRNRSDFQEIDLTGVALSADGTLRLSAKVTSLLDSTQPNLWCLARDGKGRAYVGGGNEGKVFRIDPAGGGKPEMIFDADELEVHALAVDARGALYAGTSPRGAVYRIDESGARTVIFNPEETYIWALQFDDRGRLLVATGQRGRVYRVDSVGPNSSGKVVLDGREDHVRSLARASDGAIYAGSDQNGILYRIPADGAASVIYDSPMREIAALAVMGDQIYMAALAPAPRPRGGGGGGAAVQGGVTRVRVTADEGGGEPEQPQGGGEEDQEPQRRQQQARPPAPPEQYFGAVYKVSPEGYARKLWESREALPLALAPFGDGRLLVGTGNDGRVMLLDDTGSVTDFVAVQAQQVNGLMSAGADGFIAAASNLGQVFLIDPAAAREGSVLSRSYDAGFTSSWGAISWMAEMPSGSSVAISIRTGNTETPDDSWSAWSAEYTRADGSIIERPRARYLQWKALLRAGREGGTPVLRNIQINYLQDNLPPEVSNVEVLPAGVVLSPTGSGEGSEGGPPGRRPQGQSRRSFEKGKRSVQWKAEDGNDDAMVYEVFFKAEDETLWKPLAHDLQDQFCSWDATAMPDGVYRIQVIASDAPSNPPGTALASSHLSPAFDVDNTPPVVGAIEARLRSRVAEVKVTVTDSFSVVGDVAYSLDADDWTTVLPEDRIADSMKESYLFRTPELAPGEHTITVRARDRAGNTAANKVVLRVEK
jgi:sugar lactone lactonase YvrE